MDKLDIMFSMQKKLQDSLGIFEKIKNEEDKQAYINQMLLACFEEVTEIMKKTAYKNPEYVKFGWKKNQKWNLEVFKIEIVDLFHFMMNLCLATNITADEFYKIYCEKNLENYERQKRGY